MYLEQACLEGSLSHGPLFFCTFSPQMRVLNFVWVEKKWDICVFYLLCFFGKLCLGRALRAELSSFLLSIDCVWLVPPEFNSHFRGSNEPQISLLTRSKCLRFQVVSWGSYRKPRDTPDFSTGLSWSCFWTKGHAIKLRFTELSTLLSHCRQFWGFLQGRKINWLIN